MGIACCEWQPVLKLDVKLGFLTLRSNTGAATGNTRSISQSIQVMLLLKHFNNTNDDYVTNEQQYLR